MIFRHTLHLKHFFIHFWTLDIRTSYALIPFPIVEICWWKSLLCSLLKTPRFLEQILSEDSRSEILKARCIPKFYMNSEDPPLYHSDFLFYDFQENWNICIFERLPNARLLLRVDLIVLHNRKYVKCMNDIFPIIKVILKNNIISHMCWYKIMWNDGENIELTTCASYTNWMNIHHYFERWYYMSDVAGLLH